MDWSSSFFFFQAEDGIRDLTVTGVQTCALPISRDAAPRSLLPAPLQHRQPAGYGEDQRQSPERNREGRCRSEPDDGSGVAGGEHCHDQHEERRHGRETSPPSPRSATGCRPRSPPPNCALHAPPARVARRDIAPRPYGRGSARSPRTVAVRADWSLGHTLPRAPHRGGGDRRPLAPPPPLAPERPAARARDPGYPPVEPCPPGNRAPA